MSKAKVAPSLVQPGTVFWQRNFNLEAKLTAMGIAWAYVEKVPLGSLRFDSENSVRLEDKLDQDRVTDIGFKILEYGLALPALVCRDENKKGLGGHHRYEGCKEAGIKFCDVYMLPGIGPAMEGVVGVIDNFGGKPMTLEEIMYQAVMYVIAHPGEDLVTVAKCFEVKMAKLRDQTKIFKFRQTMSQPSTLVHHRDNLKNHTVLRLLTAKSRVNEPILYEMANALARYKTVTDTQARELIDAVVGADPKTDDNMRSIMLAEESKLAAKQTLVSGKTKKSVPVGERVTTECRRMLGATEILDHQDPRDVYLSVESRVEFIDVAKGIVSRLQKAIKTLKETM